MQGAGFPATKITGRATAATLPIPAHRFVIGAGTHDMTAPDVTLNITAGAFCLGVSDTAVTALGDPIGFYIDGAPLVEVAGAIANNAWIMSDNVGRATTYVAGNTVMGIMIDDDSTAAGELRAIKLLPQAAPLP